MVTVWLVVQDPLLAITVYVKTPTVLSGPVLLDPKAFPCGSYQVIVPFDDAAKVTDEPFVTAIELVTPVNVGNGVTFTVTGTFTDGQATPVV